MEKRESRGSNLRENEMEAPAGQKIALPSLPAGVGGLCKCQSVAVRNGRCATGANERLQLEKAW